MKLKIFDDYDLMSTAAVDIIIETLQKKPTALLCFATGDTPILTYKKLVEVIKKEKLDIGNCFFIGLDEWLGIPPDNTGSCHYFLHKHLFEPLSISKSQICLFNGLTKNEAMECKKMDDLIEEKGPVDLMLVGVGMNGHIGFNEPGTDPHSSAHIAMLDDTTKTVGQKYFDQQVTIKKGITLGLKQVMNTKQLLMIANGSKKADVVKSTVYGKISTDFPSTLIRNHGNAMLFIDKEAASKLAATYS
jgi:glucosamine-6-phosphate isomerase